MCNPMTNLCFWSPTQGGGGVVTINKTKNNMTEKHVTLPKNMLYLIFWGIPTRSFVFRSDMVTSVAPFSLVVCLPCLGSQLNFSSKNKNDIPVMLG